MLENTPILPALSCPLDLDVQAATPASTTIIGSLPTPSQARVRRNIASLAASAMENALMWRFLHQRAELGG